LSSEKGGIQVNTYTFKAEIYRHSSERYVANESAVVTAPDRSDAEMIFNDELEELWDEDEFYWDISLIDVS